MTVLILLFSLGILFLAVEVLVPGGILGVIGGLFMLTGCIFAYMDYGPSGGTVALLFALSIAGFTVFLELYLLPRTRLGRRIFLTSEVKGVSAALGPSARELIGHPAVALTMLSPSGYVEVQGRRYEAFCQTGQVPTGTLLEVSGADNFRLIVRLKLN